MQVEAIYNQGRIEFVNPIQLKHDHLRLVVLVPDEEVLIPAESSYVLTPEELAKVQAETDKYRAILDAPLPPDDELPELSPEYEARIEAMELRAEWRKEQGRPV